MTVIVTTRDDAFEDWRLNTNADSANMGDITTVYTSDVGNGITDTLAPSLSIGYGPNLSPITPIVTAVNDLNSRKVKRSGDTITGQIRITDATAASSPSTGSLVITGGIGVTGNVYSSGNIYGTWAGTAIAYAKGGTGLTSLGAANSVLGVNAGATGLEYKSLSSGDGSIAFTMGANSVDIRTSGILPNAVNMNNTLIVGKQVLAGTWRGTDLGAITAGNAFEVRTFSGSTLTNLLTLATDYDNSGGAATVFNVSSTGSLTVGANKLTVAAATGNTAVAGTFSAGGDALFSTNATVSGNLIVTGTFTVNGATTVINAAALTIADNAIEIGAAVGGANDSTANNGGIILKGATDKSLLWTSSGTNWTSSENFNIAVNKVYKINNTQVLSASTLGSGVIYSSLTSVGTITSGVWNGGVVPITYGGTGQSSAAAAINGLVPAGGSSGQALLTTGSSVYWGTPTATITIGTTVNSQRSTAAGDGTTVIFTGLPTYTPGTGQLRVYINGVRQFPSTYTESGTTQVTLSTAPQSSDSIMFEVDAYTNYAITAGSVSITTIAEFPAVTEVQTALATLSTIKAPLSSPTFTGTPASVTAAADTNTTQIATTAWVLGQRSTSNPLIDGTAAAGSSAKLSREDHVHPTDTSRAAAAGPVFTGTVTLPVGSTTVQPLKWQAGAKLTAAIAHSMEWDGTDLWQTRSTGARAQIVVADGGTTTWSATVSNATTATTATTATNATYLAATQQTNVITGKQSSLNMAISDTTNNGGFVCRATGTGDSNLAGMTFSNDAYAIKLGVRADGYFGLGGSSRAAWSWYSDGSGNMVAAGNVSAYSDPRLKENVVRIDSALDKLDKLDGVTFTWKEGIAHTAVKAGKSDIGILADQVEAVFPEIVTDSIAIDGDSYKTVCYEKLVPVLIEAIKELRAEVRALKGV